MRYSYRVMADEVSYEIKMRRQVYPGLVSRGKLRKPEAEMKIRILEAVRETLLRMKDREDEQEALKALIAYASHQGRRGAPMRGDPDDMQCIITDLLTDLRHYCAANGEDFEKHMSRSAAHFNAEIAE